MSVMNPPVQTRPGVTVRPSFPRVLQGISSAMCQVQDCLEHLEEYRAMLPEDVPLPDTLICMIESSYEVMGLESNRSMTRYEARVYFKQFGDVKFLELEEDETSGDDGMSLREWHDSWYQVWSNGYTEEQILKEIATVTKGDEEQTADSTRTGRARAANHSVMVNILHPRDLYASDEDDSSALEVFEFINDQSLQQNALSSQSLKRSSSMSNTRSSAAASSDRRRSHRAAFLLKGSDGNAASRPCWCVPHQYTLHPHSSFRMAWDGLGSIAVLWDMFLLPVSFLISDHVFAESVQIVLEFIVAIYWSMDMLISCITGYETSKTIQRDLKSVVKRYLSTWFCFDLLLVAIEWLTLSSASSTQNLNALKSLTVARFIRLFRLFRLAKLWKYMQKLYDVTSSLKLQAMIGILKLAASMLLLVHVFACGWYYVGTASGELGWVAKRNYGDEVTLVRYAESFRWAMGQITGGGADSERLTVQETLFMVFLLTSSVIFMSHFIGSMTTKLLDLQSVMQREREFMQAFHTYSETHQLSWATVYWCKRYIKENLSRISERDAEAQLLSLLPPQSQVDLLFEVRITPLSKHFFFRALATEFQPAFRDILAGALVSVNAQELEAVFEKGEVLDAMIFIDGGNAVYSRSPGAKQTLRNDLEEQETVPVLQEALASLCGNRSRKTFRYACAELTDCVQLASGSWISEPAIWAKTWMAQGSLIMFTPGKLVSLKGPDLARLIRRHPDTLYAVSFYARCILEQVRTLFLDCDESDIVPISMQDLLAFKSVHAEPHKEPGTPTKKSYFMGVLADCSANANQLDEAHKASL